MPSLMCGCSGIHPLQQHIRLGIDLFATACLIEEGLACHLGGSWQELRAAWTKWKIPRKRTCSFLGIFHFVPENSCFEVFCNKDVLVRGITTLYHDPVTEIFILQKHVFNVWTSQCVCTTHQLRTCAIVPHGPKDGKGRKKIPRQEQGREVSLETLRSFSWVSSTSCPRTRAFRCFATKMFWSVHPCQAVCMQASWLEASVISQQVTNVVYFAGLNTEISLSSDLRNKPRSSSVFEKCRPLMSVKSADSRLK